MPDRSASATAVARVPERGAGVKVIKFEPIRRGALLGFVSIEMPASGMVFHDVSLVETNGRVWAAPPAKPVLGRDGAQLREANGKGRYAPTVSFTSRERQNAFSDAVLAAVRAQCPGVLS